MFFRIRKRRRWNDIADFYRGFGGVLINNNTPIHLNKMNCVHLEFMLTVRPEDCVFALYGRF